MSPRSMRPAAARWPLRRMLAIRSGRRRSHGHGRDVRWPRHSGQQCWHPLGGPITDISFADYERMLAVNVTGVFVATQEAARRMTAGDPLSTSAARWRFMRRSRAVPSTR